MIYSNESKQGKAKSSSRCHKGAYSGLPYSLLNMDTLQIKNIHFCPVIQCIILTCGVVLCFIIASIRNDVSIYLPFVSETGAYSPEKPIFSLTLIIGSFLGFLTVSSFFLMIRENALNTNRTFAIINMLAVSAGCIAMLGLAGVAAFPMTTVFWTHLMFAGIYFVGSGIYIGFVSLITYRMEGLTKKFFFRCGLAIAIGIFLFLLVIIFPLSLSRWNHINDFIPALKTPENKGFTLLLISSVLEWSIVIVIILFTLSLTLDLKKHSFQLSVLATPAKNAIPAEDTIPPNDGQ